MAIKNSKEVLELINLVLEEKKNEDKPIATRELVLIVSRTGDWDVPLGTEILYFDANLSYELSGYRPIDATHGLDFDPTWFMDARSNYLSTGAYCSSRPGSKAFLEYWNEEYKRCRDGLTVHGYTITGDNYFFLNYYQLPNLASADKAGAGRSINFPNFYVKQYEYFHYIELCKRLRLNAVGLKARGVGFSEIGAAIAANTYTCRPHTRSVIAAEKSIYVEATLDKCWKALNFLDDNAPGFAKLRQGVDLAYKKRASKKDTNGKEFGWMSEIEGIAADTPNKIRGDRVDYLVYEESGSWKSWTKAFIQGDALVYILGRRFGIKVGWGTGRAICQTLE